MQLIHGDCLIEMAQIPDHSVDMILCDLPYGTTACKWDVIIPFEPLWEHYWRVIKPNGVIVLFGSEPFSSYLRMSQIKYYKYDWIWQKPTASNFCLAKKQPLKQHEIISIFYKTQPVYNPQMQEREGSGLVRVHTGFKTNMNYKSGNKSEVASKVSLEIKQNNYNGDMRYPCSVQKTTNKSDKGYHATQKPVILLKYLIKTYTNEGETVLDNCMGSGSTGVACIQTNRNFIGIEKDEKYFEIAKNRINGIINGA